MRSILLISWILRRSWSESSSVCDWVHILDLRPARFAIQATHCLETVHGCVSPLESILRPVVEFRMLSDWASYIERVSRGKTS